MKINTDQITQLLKEKIKSFDESIDVLRLERSFKSEMVYCVSGLENVMSSEFIEMPNNVFGMALNLEEDNVGLVLFGETSLVKEGDIVKER